MAKMSIIFDGFKDLAYQIDKSGADLKTAVNEALTETADYIQGQVTTAAAPYASKGLKGYATGAMYSAIINDRTVYWKGNIAEVNVGFHLPGGGWHSIFVMYGTPRMAKDTRLYNAIKGSKTRSEIEKIQREIMQKYIKIGGE